MPKPRFDMLELTLYFNQKTDLAQRYLKVHIAPEDWDTMFENGVGFIDETNQERAAILLSCDD